MTIDQELSGDLMDDLSTPLLDAINQKLANPASSCGGDPFIQPTSPPQTSPPTSSPKTKTPTASPQTETPTKFPTPQPTSAPIPTAPTLPPSGPSPMSCPQGYTGLRPADKCTKYYHCVNGVATGDKLPCPPDTLFDVNYDVCNWADQVSCDIDDSPDTPSPTVAPSLPPPQGPMSCPQGYTGLRPADTCTKFYHCVNGVITGDKISCPPDTLFDVNYNFCNWANQVTCDSSRRRDLRRIMKR